MILINPLFLLVIQQVQINQLAVQGDKGDVLELQEAGIRSVLDDENVFDADAKVAVFVVSRFCG